VALESEPVPAETWILPEEIRMAAVTIARIKAVQDDLAKAIVQTSERSTLSKREQDQLLEQSCGEACDLLTDWLDSEWWRAMRPSSDKPIGEYFEEFLGPELQDVLTRAGMTVSADQVDQARKAVEAIGSYRKMLGQLFQDAAVKVETLKQDVCRLADQLHDRGATRKQKAARRQHARRTLGAVGTVLPALVIGMAGVTPEVAAHNLSVWDQQIINVIAVHSIANVMATESATVTATHSTAKVTATDSAKVTATRSTAGAASPARPRVEHVRRDPHVDPVDAFFAVAIQVLEAPQRLLRSLSRRRTQPTRVPTRPRVRR
jgi:hypothetical protein